MKQQGAQNGRHENDELQTTRCLKVSRSYHSHVPQSLTPVCLRFSVRRPDGKLVRCEGDMVPLSYAGQMFAYHFVWKVRATSRAKASPAKRRSATKKPTARRRQS